MYEPSEMVKIIVAQYAESQCKVHCHTSDGRPVHKSQGLTVLYKYFFSPTYLPLDV